MLAIWSSLTPYLHDKNLTLYRTIATFNELTLKEKTFENNMEKGENAGNQHFLLFPQCFLPLPNRF